MATNTNILREYLIKLGYRVDDSSSKKFDLSVLKSERSVTGLGKAVVGMGVATTVAVGLFARSMERLYYSSIKAESAAGKIKGLEFGFKQIGLTGDAARSVVEGMARAVRTNPGLVGLLESMGVRVTGRDMSDVAVDFVAALKKMPFYLSSQYANLFGIDADTLLLMQNGLDKLKEVSAERQRLANAAGLDMTKVAEAGKEYAQLLTDIWERVGIVKDAALLALLPAFREVAGVVREVLDDWAKIARDFGKPGDLLRRLKEGITGKSDRGAVTLNAEAKARLGIASPFASSFNHGRSAINPLTGSPTASPPAEKLFRGLEDAFGLPRGLLDKMWKKESSRGTHMLSPAGAKGHFQFMDPTAKQYGVTDPNDLEQSAGGAARYMADLLRKYNGDLSKALAAYNWGPGNVDRKGLGAAPLETQNYVREISGQPINIENNIVVHGSTSPDATGVAVGRSVENANSAALRNTVGAYR